MKSITKCNLIITGIMFAAAGISYLVLPANVELISLLFLVPPCTITIPKLLWEWKND